MTSLQQSESTAHTRATAAPRDAITLLKSGAAILLIGILSAASIYIFFGGISRQGPHTNTGWLALIVAMMCVPFGLMLFTLGAAKYFGHKR